MQPARSDILISLAGADGLQLFQIARAGVVASVTDERGQPIRWQQIDDNILLVEVVAEVNVRLDVGDSVLRCTAALIVECRPE